ncbi:MAG: potassium transporter TrkG [Euryarchaeota archaeon]|nr:potassium transporter TrkG [Euryarchaeota archaeon]
MNLELIDALIVTALTYLLFALLGSLPFLPIMPPINGFFEAISGFTTTGLTMAEEATLPLSLHFFRAYSQWLGGMGIIIVSLAILLRPGKAAFRLYETEFGEENIIGSVVATAKMIIWLYLILTVVGFVAYLIAGMGPFDGLIHILTTIPTGGFSRFSESIGHYHSDLISLPSHFSWCLVL